jgi:hypothetical protein
VPIADAPAGVATAQSGGRPERCAWSALAIARPERTSRDHRGSPLARPSAASVRGEW